MRHLISHELAVLALQPTTTTTPCDLVLLCWHSRRQQQHHLVFAPTPQVAAFVLHKLKVDDPLDAFAVHGACGTWGIIAAALWSTDYYTR